MLHSFITIYTFDLWITMLFRVLFFLCLPVFSGELNNLPQINNVIHITLVASDTVFVRRQDGLTECKGIIIPHTTRCRYLIRNFRYRLG